MTGQDGVTNRRPIGRLVVRVALSIGVAAATIFVMRTPIRTEPFMGDETDWISSGNYYTALVLSGDFGHERWVANHLGIVGNFNQNLGKVLLGLGIRMHPGRQPGDTDYIVNYDWGLTPAGNEAKGQVPSDGLLVRARESALVFVAGCAVLLFVAGTVFGGEVAGLTAVALVLGSTQIHSLLALAMTDSYYNFFILFGLVAAIGLVRAETTRRFIGFSALLGLSAGLACSVKITGLPLVAFFYCLLLPGIWAVRGFSLGTTLYGPTVALATGVLTAYVLNPFFWPFESPRLLLEFPNLFVRTQQAFAQVPEAAREWGTPPDRLGLIHQRLFASSFLSFRAEPLLFVAGLAISGWRFARGLRARRFDVFGVPLIYFFSHYVFIVLLIQFNFARYYLPLVFSMKLLAGIGVAVPVYWAWNRMRRTQADGAVESAG